VVLHEASWTFASSGSFSRFLKNLKDESDSAEGQCSHRTATIAVQNHLKVNDPWSNPTTSPLERVFCI
jgi:hypothetical protein